MAEIIGGKYIFNRSSFGIFDIGGVSTLIFVAAAEQTVITDVQDWWDNKVLNRLYNNVSENDFLNGIQTYLPLKKVGGTYDYNEVFNAVSKSWNNNIIGGITTPTDIKPFEIFALMYILEYITDADNNKLFQVINDFGVTKLKVLSRTDKSGNQIAIPSYTP